MRLYLLRGPGCTQRCDARCARVLCTPRGTCRRRYCTSALCCQVHAALCVVVAARARAQPEPRPAAALQVKFDIDNTKPGWSQLHPKYIIDQMHSLQKRLVVVAGKDGLSKEAQRNATVTFLSHLRSHVASKRVLAEYKLNQQVGGCHTAIRAPRDV
jgi:hypothetical protein